MGVLSEIFHIVKSGGFVRDLFHIPKHGRLPESTFLVRIALSIAVIFGSLGAMGLSAYAYFRTTDVVKSGMMQSADYLLDMTVGGSPLVGGQLSGTAGQTFEVTLTKNGSAQTGFCVITVRRNGAADVVYHTQQIGTDQKVSSGKTEAITFTVHFDCDATLLLEPHWGTSSNYAYGGYELFEQEPKENAYIVNGETLTVAAVSLQSEPPQQTTVTTTTTVTTVTTTVTTATTTTTVAEPEKTEDTDGTASSTSTAAASTQENETITSTSVVNTTPSEEN